MIDVINQFVTALISVNRIGIRDIIDEHYDGKNPFQFIEKYVVPAAEIIGEGWTKGVVALSQVYLSARIIEELVDEILPPGSPDRIGQPRMAIAVLEDYHLLGKRIVYSMLRASGYAIRDYGRMTVSETLERVKADGIEILFISTLMLRSALRIKDLRREMNRSGLKTRMIVGGAPFRFDEQLWREVGADATAKDAAGALTVLNQMQEGLS